MSSNTLCKTICQYNSKPIPEDTMRKLQEIADDYSKVKNYVYARYGGVGGFSKIYPGYTVQNEMTGSGLREQLDMPSVYFYLAVFDALGDIKIQWTQTKSRVLKAIKIHQTLTAQEAHYLRFALKVNPCLDAILNYRPVKLKGEYQKNYEQLAEEVDISKVNSYLRRQVRKHLRTIHTDRADGFSITERAYRYADHGIHISIKQKRKRVFIPLTDSNRYDRQLYIRLHRESRRLEILVPINVHIKSHDDYRNQVGISTGMLTMLTTDSGNFYGKDLGAYIMEEAEWVQRQTVAYMNNKAENPGRKKYQNQKQKLDARLHTYINTELNRFIREEKPKVIYIPKLPPPGKSGYNKKYNRSINMWQKGYIRKRLNQKCKEQSIEIVEVFGKGIGAVCSKCQNPGEKKNGIFFCPVCGLQKEYKVNAAINAKRRGMQQYESAI